MADTGTTTAIATTAINAVPISIVSSHELWSFSNALMFLIILVIVIMVAVTGMSAVSQVKGVSNDWAKYRCNPMVMPFAGLFGYNAKENFDFCMNTIFTNFSMPFLHSNCIRN